MPSSTNTTKPLQEGKGNTPTPPSKPIKPLFLTYAHPFSKSLIPPTPLFLPIPFFLPLLMECLFDFFLGVQRMAFQYMVASALSLSTSTSSPSLLRIIPNPLSFGLSLLIFCQNPFRSPLHPANRKKRRKTKKR
jgi:hypothetical protein